MSEHRWQKKDLYVLAALLLIFLPLYVFRLYTIPYQINTDEITIMHVERSLLAQDANPFGLSWYFGFPSFIFIVFGKIGQWLGGITLYHMRLVHAVSGVLIILLSYLFFRLLRPPLFSFIAAALLGANHALFAISRMAMRDNTGLLFELLALFLLLWGYKNRSPLLNVLGGLALGLTFYTYFPSRATIFVWGAFILWEMLRGRAVKYAALAAVAGFFVVAFPVLSATVQARPEDNLYAKQQVLVFPEGRVLQQTWEGQPTQRAAVIDNARRGLAMFNTPEHDRGYIYPNYGHGFLDPATGILLWAGLLAWLLWPRQRKDEEHLVIAGFLLLYLAFSLLLTKAPNYTRLLVILPFVAYLAARGLEGGTELLSKAMERRWVLLPKLLPLGAVIIIVAHNALIFSDFNLKGLHEGNDVGSTARYVEARRNAEPYSFYMLADEATPYYSWGQAPQWQIWLSFFAADHQEVRVITPTELAGNLSKLNKPFTIFLGQALAEQALAEVKTTAPEARLVPITKDATRMAIEVR